MVDDVKIWPVIPIHPFLGDVWYHCYSWPTHHCNSPTVKRGLLQTCRRRRDGGIGTFGEAWCGWCEDGHHWWLCHILGCTKGVLHIYIYLYIYSTSVHCFLFKLVLHIHAFTRCMSCFIHGSKNRWCDSVCIWVMQWNQNASGFQLGIVCIYDVNIDIVLLVHAARLLMTT